MGKVQMESQVKNCPKAKEEKNSAVYRKYLCIFKAKEEKMENPFQFLHNVNECLLTLYKVAA